LGDKARAAVVGCWLGGLTGIAAGAELAIRVFGENVGAFLWLVVAGAAAGMAIGSALAVAFSSRHA
jgi:hypothetical protein